MSYVITFDTLQYVKRAREIGMSEKEAEFQAEEMAKIINEQNEHLATKNDLNKTKDDIIKDLTIRVGYMLFAFSSFIIGILALVLKYALN